MSAIIQVHSEFGRCKHMVCVLFYFFVQKKVLICTEKYGVIIYEIAFIYFYNKYAVCVRKQHLAASRAKVKP